jgi:periplasmic copper chaperone A
MHKMPYSSKTFRRGTAVAAAFAFLISGSLTVLAASAPETTPPAPEATPPATPAPAAAPTPASEAAKARAAAVAAKANVDIGEGWTRAAAGDATAAIYLKIASVKDADRLVGIDVAIAAKAELREETSQNGGGKPLAAQTLDIPAGTTVEFKPGGRYLALSGLKAPLSEGESFLITLKFDKAGTQNMPVKVLGASANGLSPVGSNRRGDSTAAVSQR